MKMGKRTKYGLLVAILGVAFGMARVYGAYQNEQRRALAIEAQFTRWASQLDRSLKWSFYQSTTRMMASNKQLEKFEPKLAAEEETRLKNSSFYTPTEPACHLQDNDPLMPQDLNVKAMQAIAVAAHKYAFDRGLQTKHILNNAWAAISGTNSETTEEQVANLAK
jgi:hypothetical protein